MTEFKRLKADIKHNRISEAIDKIIENPNLIDMKDEQGISIFMWAILYDRISFCSLIKDRVNINQIDNLRRTSLMYAAMEPGDNVKFLLDNGAEINLQDNAGKTALIHNISYIELTGNFSVAHLLIERGADPNIQDRYGRTFIMYAAEIYVYDDIKKLIETFTNINLSIEDNDGKTASDYAVNENIKHLLYSIPNECDSMLLNMECGICFENLNGIVKYHKSSDIFHAFHEDCINPWLIFNSSCPLCRKHDIFHRCIIKETSFGKRRMIKKKKIKKKVTKKKVIKKKVTRKNTKKKTKKKTKKVTKSSFGKLLKRNLKILFGI